MISVVIATRNRVRQLESCLRRFQELDLSGVSAWELIVVDNGSSDGTDRMVRSLAEEEMLPLVYVCEPKPGVSRARNAGIRKAQYEILAFTDDDCYVNPNWLSEILRAFREETALALVGGRVDLHDPEDFEISVRSFDDPCEVSTLTGLYRRLIGCNMALSAEAIRKAGPFDPAIGAGTSFRGAEDHEFFYRILKDGGKVLYDPRIRIEHAHGRRTAEQIRTLKRNYIEGRAALMAKHIRAGDRKLIKEAYWELRALISSRQGTDGTANEPEYRHFGVYGYALLRGLLFLR